MKLKNILYFVSLMISQAYADDHIDDLWERLNTDFESKPQFFNTTVNDERNGVMSDFIPILFKEYASNNALPLSAKQLAQLPEARFLDKTPFRLAMAGRERLLKAGKIKNFPLLAVTDFSKHSRFRRFFILDVEKGEVLLNTWTSHAFNSDANLDGLADAFSNVSGSQMSSVGFMMTDVQYKGAYGLSLRLKGLDQKLNSNVFSRAVVIHGFGGMGAHEASRGNLSYSEGCLMFSTNESGRFTGMEDKSLVELVIKTLKSGALLFNYTDQGETIFQSSWIKKTDVPEE